MAYILEEKLVPRISSIWTSPVLPGTVQCTPNGTLIILMRDAQTTGGYPRILQVTDEGLNILAQKSTKECFQFQLSSV
jgi:allophanate hydrolase subunit 2